MDKRWLLKDEPDAEIVAKLENELSVPKAIAVLLAQRGISTFGEAKDFFRPTTELLQNPMQM